MFLFLNFHIFCCRKSNLPYSELIYIDQKQNITHCNLPISLQNVVYKLLRDNEEMDGVNDDSQSTLATTPNHRTLANHFNRQFKRKNFWKHCKYLYFANFDQVREFEYSLVDFLSSSSFLVSIGQILLLKSPHRVVAHLQRNPEHIIQPHLLKAFSAEVRNILYASRFLMFFLVHCLIR